MGENIALTVILLFFTVYTVFKDMFLEKNDIPQLKFVKIVVIAIIVTMIFTIFVLLYQ